MIAPMNSLGARIVARTTGSRISEILPSGNSLGLVTSTWTPPSSGHVVLDVRQGRDEVEVELAFQPLADDLEVQHPEEPDPEAEAQRRGRLRLVDQRGVVELEPVERVAQGGVVGPVDRVQPGEDHRLGVAVAGERRRGRLGGVGDGVADPALADVLDAGDEVADLPDPETLRRHRLRRDHADLEQVVGGPRRHHDDPLTRVEVAVDDPDVGDDAAVGVVDRVEDHRPGGSGGVAGRAGDLPHDLVHEDLDALPRLARDAQTVLRLQADQAGQLLGVLLRLGRRQVDLVEHRDDREVVLHREVEVRQRLRLDPLSGVDEQDGALAGGQAARHLVGEVDVPGGVDHVQRVGRPVELPRHPDGLALDGDATLALDVHPVEVLRPHRAVVDDAGELEHPVGQRRLAVVDVGDDAEVPDQVRWRRVGRQRGSGPG